VRTFCKLRLVGFFYVINKKLILFYEKNYRSFLFIIFSYFLLAKKSILYQDFKELSTAKGAAYYSTYEDNKGTTRSTYFIDGTKRNYDQFSNLKNVF
jgi:hypothetical protein